MKYDCLIIDDEKPLADSTAEYFNLFGIHSIAVYSIEDCHQFFKTHSTELILLDINLSDGSGFQLCKYLRKETQIPILFISARTSDDDQIAALSIGGDDYIQKPYSLGVLLAKVKAVLKRYKSNDELIYSDERILIDVKAKKVLVENEPVRLTSLELKLLVYLVEHKGRVISKQELFEQVWEDKFTQDGTLNVHIRRLRMAIEVDANHPKYILTMWKDGYKFVGGER